MQSILRGVGKRNFLRPFFLIFFCSEKIPTVEKLAKTVFKIDFERYFANLLVFLKYCSFGYWSGIGILEYIF